MNLVVFAIKDIKAKSLTTVFMDKDELAAKRQLSVVVNSNNQSMYRTFPAEFQLLKLGEVDMASGALEASFEEICVLDELKNVNLEKVLTEGENHE